MHDHHCVIGLGNLEDRVYQFLIAERKTAQRRVQLHPFESFLEAVLQIVQCLLPVPRIYRAERNQPVRIFIHVIHDLVIVKVSFRKRKYDGLVYLHGIHPVHYILAAPDRGPFSYVRMCIYFQHPSSPL